MPGHITFMLGPECNSLQVVIGLVSPAGCLELGCLTKDMQVGSPF